MKVLAFGASSSKNSINRTVASWAARQIPGAEVEVLDLNDFEMPLFSVDREREFGQPPQARHFLDKIALADALVISFAEHNGSFTAAYKNLYDWSSRIEKKVYQGKPAVFLSTSPGGRGGASVLATAESLAPFHGADLRASLSIPTFSEAFDPAGEQPRDDQIARQLREAVAHLLPKN